jgi:hypothetical protein
MRHWCARTRFGAVELAEVSSGVNPVSHSGAASPIICTVYGCVLELAGWQAACAQRCDGPLLCCEPRLVVCNDHF